MAGGWGTAAVGGIGLLWAAAAVSTRRRERVGAWRWAALAATAVGLAVAAVTLWGRWEDVLANPGAGLATVGLFGGLWGALAAEGRRGEWLWLGVGTGLLIALGAALWAALPSRVAPGAARAPASDVAYAAATGSLCAAAFMASSRPTGADAFGILLRAGLALQVAALLAFAVALQRATGDPGVWSAGFLQRAAGAVATAVAALDERHADVAARRPAILGSVALGVALLVLLGSAPMAAWAARSWGAVQP